MPLQYVLLDTDFISKAYSVTGRNDDRLIDLVVSLEHHTFYCHAQIVTELGRHNNGATGWLNELIRAGGVGVYTDEQILHALSEYYGTLAYDTYAGYLRNACDAFSANYYNEYYVELETLLQAGTDDAEFCAGLAKCDQAVGHSNNLGEIKTYVLLQLLQFLHGENIYVFCSDDRRARTGILNIGAVRCVSILTLFLRLQRLLGWGTDDMESYIRSWVAFCDAHGQTTFRVVEASPVGRLVKVEGGQLIQDMLDGRFEALQNGYLRYIA